MDDDYSYLDDTDTVIEPTMTDNGDGSSTDADGQIWMDGEVIGKENGDGTWTDLQGTIYDASNNPLNWDPYTGSPDNAGAASGGFGDFLKKLFGGGSGSAGGGSSGGGFGGGSGGGGSQQQRPQSGIANPPYISQPATNWGGVALLAGGALLLGYVAASRDRR